MTKRKKNGIKKVDNLHTASNRLLFVNPGGIISVRGYRSGFVTKNGWFGVSISDLLDGLLEDSSKLTLSD